MTFEEDIEFLFGDRIRYSDAFAERVYAALTNTIWKRGEEEFSASFRWVGGFIAQIRGEGHYMDWYCSAGEGVVDRDIALALAIKGWYHES